MLTSYSEMRYPRLRPFQHQKSYHDKSTWMCAKFCDLGNDVYAQTVTVCSSFPHMQNLETRLHYGGHGESYS